MDPKGGKIGVTNFGESLNISVQFKEAKYLTGKVELQIDLHWDKLI